MPHKLTQLTGEPIWMLTLEDRVRVQDLHPLLMEVMNAIKQLNSSSGVMIDWREAEALKNDEVHTYVEVIGEWMMTIPMSPPVFLVFMCEDASVRAIAQTLEKMGFVLPILQTPEESFTYLSLKIASSQVKDSMRSSQTHNLDPALRLELIAAAEQARLYLEGHEGDETEKFPQRGVLRLEAAGMDKSILVFPEKGGVLGRRDAKGQKPDVDLSLWSGFHSGVSRRHAEVMVGPDGHLYLLDLDSTNGTFLNGIRIEPEEPQQIAHGDEIRLGSLVMHIYFQSVSKDE